jgi:hypothetical protein
MSLAGGEDSHSEIAGSATGSSPRRKIRIEVAVATDVVVDFAGLVLALTIPTAIIEPMARAAARRNLMRALA